VAGYVGLAKADTSTTAEQIAQNMPEREAHVDGTITAVSGTTITITAAQNHGGGTYTIDASSATIMKDGSTVSLTDYAVGDQIIAVGTVNGTSVIATKIMNGGMGFGHGPGGFGHHGFGHGIGGEVSAVVGSTITVTGANGESYTVDAGSATVHRMVAGSLSDVKVGDRIGVKGTVSGNTVTATQIMDGLPKSSTDTP